MTSHDLRFDALEERVETIREGTVTAIGYAADDDAARSLPSRERGVGPRRADRGREAGSMTSIAQLNVGRFRFRDGRSAHGWRSWTTSIVSTRSPSAARLRLAAQGRQQQCNRDPARRSRTRPWRSTYRSGRASRRSSASSGRRSTSSSTTASGEWFEKAAGAAFRHVVDTRRAYPGPRRSDGAAARHLRSRRATATPRFCFHERLSIAGTAGCACRGEG